MTRKTHSIIIVGGSSSIGNAIISRFHSPSNRIIASYFSRQRIKSGKNIHSLKLDLKSNKSIEYFIKKARAMTSHIDAAIFLAGILPGKNLKEYNPADIENVLAVNFAGQAKVIKGLLPLFNPDSQIIMVSSISAQRGSYDPIYAASKGAILSFVKSLAIGLNGVRVNAIAPGLIANSTMFNEMPADRREFHRRQIPCKELLKMSDLADVIYDISKPHWKHLNGACIDLNAGQYVR